MKIFELFTKAAPNALPNYVDGVKNALPTLQAYAVTTPERRCHFLAQVLHECDKGTILFENMRYTTTERLLKIFGVGNHSAKVTAAEAPGLLRNAPALGERVYGLGNPRKARELGNTQPGDGYRYRGGGALQTTGRAAYRTMGARIGVDLEAHPEKIVDAAHAFIPAIEEWNDGELNDAADKHRIRQITRKINGGLNGLEDRKRLFRQLWSIATDGSPPPPFGD